MTVGTAKQLTAVFDSWVAQGIHEEPAHSNRTPIGEEFGWNGVAWCCQTMSVGQTRIGLHCFHESAVVQAVADAKKGLNGLTWLPKDAVIAEGDMPCFQWGDGSHHISYVRDPGTQIKFQTDAGNEDDRMKQQWRDRKYVMGFIRLPYAHDPTTTTPGDFMAALTDAEQHELLNLVREIDAVVAKRGYIETIVQYVQKHADDPNTGTGAGTVDIDKLKTGLADELAKRLKD